MYDMIVKNLGETGFNFFYISIANNVHLLDVG